MLFRAIYWLIGGLFAWSAAMGLVLLTFVGIYAVTGYQASDYIVFVAHGIIMMAISYRIGHLDGQDHEMEMQLRHYRNY